ncbi:hypothetical protein [Desulfoscipio gibsoniae]
MKFRVDGLGFFGSRQYDTLEEARDNICDKKGREGNITVELAEDEYVSLINSYNNQLQKNISKIKTLQRELEIAQAANQRLASEISSLESQLSRARKNIAAFERQLNVEQQKSLRLENEIKILNKFIPKSKVNTGPQEVTHNPYACGLTFRRITPAPKDKSKTVGLTERSQVLMNHISRCPAIISLSVERLLGCGRKPARNILKKLWLGGYLECVECFTETNTFKLYYLPGSNIEIKTANHCCHLAVLSLLYAYFITNTETFRNLSFKISQKKGNPIYIALLSFVYIKKQNGKTMQNTYDFHVLPFRKDEQIKDVNAQGKPFYILPLKDIKEAEKVVDKNDAYTIDDNLIMNNFRAIVYFKN